MTSRNVICNGCFASGINFAASIVSLLYGEGDCQETVKIAVLAGWDSDNPAATWGGLLGFMAGKQGIEDTFGQEFSDRYNIHRTRTGFPTPNGVDNFDDMAATGLMIVDRVVSDEIGGEVGGDEWVIALVATLPAGQTCRLTEGRCCHLCARTQSRRRSVDRGEHTTSHFDLGTGTYWPKICARASGEAARHRRLGGEPEHSCR